MPKRRIRQGDTKIFRILIDVDPDLSPAAVQALAISMKSRYREWITSVKVDDPRDLIPLGDRMAALLLTGRT
jgi:hypothetical protein